MKTIAIWLTAFTTFDFETVIKFALPLFPLTLMPKPCHRHITCCLMIAVMIYACSEQPVKPVDLPDPVEETADASDLENDKEFAEDSMFLSDSAFVEFYDSLDAGHIQNGKTVTMDSAAALQIPVGSSLKNVEVFFKKVDCDKNGCELYFETEAGEEVVFCGAYGDFVSADFGMANRELVDRKFMVIYRTDNSRTELEEGANNNNQNGPCFVIVFAKQI